MNIHPNGSIIESELSEDLRTLIRSKPSGCSIVLVDMKYHNEYTSFKDALRGVLKDQYVTDLIRNRGTKSVIIIANEPKLRMRIIYEEEAFDENCKLEQSPNFCERAR